MSKLSQLFTGGQNSGGSVPVASVSALFGAGGNPIYQNGSEVYLQTGSTVTSAPDSVLALTRATGYGFDIPGMATFFSGAPTVGVGTAAPDGGGIVGANGIIIRAMGHPDGFNSLWVSTDGTNWEISNGLMGAQVMCTPVFFNGAFYVMARAVSSTTNAPADCAIFSSLDGKTWSIKQVIGGFSANSPAANLSIANNRLFAGVWTTITVSAVLMSSTDGTNWTQLDIPPIGIASVTRASKVVYTGSRYLWAVYHNSTAGAITSTDGLNWTLIASSTDVYSFDYLNSTAFQFRTPSGSFQILTGTDGSSFTTNSNGQINDTGFNGSLAWDGVTGTGATYVVATIDGVIRGTGQGASTTWSTAGITGAPAGGGGVIYAEGKFIILAGTTTYYSTNGLAWTQAAQPAGFQTTLTGDVSRNKRIYHDGTTFWLCDGVGSIMSSADGTSWAAVLATSSVSTAASRTDSALTVVNNKVFYLPSGGGIQVADASGSVFRRTLNVTAEMTGVAYGSGLFVVTSGAGVIYSSPDAITWTSRLTGGPAFNGGVASNGTMFVASSGSVATAGRYSSDGITWSSTTTTNSSHPARFVGFANGFWAAMTPNTSSYQTSSDGISWTGRSMPASSTQLQVVGDLFWVLNTAGAAQIIVRPELVLSGNTNTFLASSNSGAQTVGYNSVTDTYMVTSNNRISSAVGKTSATSTTAGPWTTVVNALSNAQQSGTTVGIVGTSADRGHFCQIPNTGNMVLFSSVAGGMMLSVNGSHFTSAGIQSRIAQNVFGGAAFITADGMYTSSISGVACYMKRNALSTGIARTTQGANPGTSAPGTGVALLYRRIA